MVEQEDRDTVGQPSDPIDTIISRDTGQQATVYEDTMLKLMQQQTELLHRLLEQGDKKKAPAPNAEDNHSKEILDVLRNINERQAASGKGLSLETAHMCIQYSMPGIQMCPNSQSHRRLQRVQRRGHHCFARTWPISNQKWIDGGVCSTPC